MEYVISILALIVGIFAGAYFSTQKSDKNLKELETGFLKAESERQSALTELLKFQSMSDQLNSEIERLNKESTTTLTKLAVSESNLKQASDQLKTSADEIISYKAAIEASNNLLNDEKIKSGKLEGLNSSNKEAKDDIEKKLTLITAEADALRKTNTELTTKLSGSDEKYNFLKNETDSELRERKAKIQTLNDENKNLSTQLASLTEQEPLRIKQYNTQLETLNRSIDNYKEIQAKQQEAIELEAIAKAQELKDTWARHEKDVEDKMKLICQQESVEYIDKKKFPLKGSPDNCVKICDEYIIFDSKSPQGEDLSNLPTYIKSQAEQAKKYANQEGVKKDIFLIVPTNSISVIKETYIPLGSYDIHIITPDALRPIIIQLKKIEEYEFAEQLSPEDRSQIAKTIGRMAHGMKRTVQVSQYMNKEMISILLDAEKLPNEVLKEAQEIDKNLKLNPPTEKRNKAIKIETLVEESGNMEGKLIGQDIYSGDGLAVIESVPLSLSDIKKV